MWKAVCQDKNDGGLGVRYVRAVIFSLLAKWRWRILQHDRPLWKEMVIAKYEEGILHQIDREGANFSYFASSWWKDILVVSIGR
jgi:hypothetical protein